MSEKEMNDIDLLNLAIDELKNAKNTLIELKTYENRFIKFTHGLSIFADKAINRIDRFLDNKVEGDIMEPLTFSDIEGLHKSLCAESWYDSLEFDGNTITVYQTRPMRLDIKELKGYEIRNKRRPKFRFERVD